jgi:hypothetical protein
MPKVAESCKAAMAAWAANETPATYQKALTAMELHHRFKKPGNKGYNKRCSAKGLFNEMKKKYERPPAQIKENNKKHNPFNNKKNNKKTQERLRREEMERLQTSQDPAFRDQRNAEALLDEDAADAMADRISTATGPTMCGMTLLNIEDGKSMEQMLKVVRMPTELTPADDADASSSSSSSSSSASTAEDDDDDDDDDEGDDFWVRVLFYFGYTGRRIKEEWLRWLTERGARPTLLWADDTNITMGDAEIELEFEEIEVFSSLWKVNARAVEGALQKRFHHLPLGHRLWRDVDKGAKYDTPKDAGKVHKVFLTYSKIAYMALCENRIKINK